MWIDRVVELEPARRLVAIKNVSLAEEHLHDHFPAEGGAPAAPVMPASLIIEGMAQTAGLLVGHAGNFDQKVILAKITKAALDRDAPPGVTLRYTAELERMEREGASSRGVVELLDHGAPEPAYERIGQIDLLFSHLDANQGTAQGFPEHNFVFGEQFRTLLRVSGVPMPGAADA